MPDRPQTRNALPRWLPLAAGGAALALLLLLIGGYFVYQDQQDRAARAAHAECVLLWKQVNNCAALKRIEEDKKYDELKAAGIGVAEAVKQASDYSNTTKSGMDEAAYQKQASRLGHLWGGRWSRLGLSLPGP